MSDLLGPREPQPCSEGCGATVLFPGPCARCAQRAKKNRITKRSIEKITAEGRCINCGGPRGDDGTAHRCRPCQEKVHVVSQRCRIAKEYGISVEEAEAIRASPCEACGAPRSVVDHCHDTGVVRGPLCANCNRAFGLLGEDPERISKLVVYAFRALAIREHHQRQGKDTAA